MNTIIPSTDTILNDINQPIELYDELDSNTPHTPPLSNSSLTSEGSHVSLTQVILAPCTSSDEEDHNCDLSDGSIECNLFISDYTIPCSQEYDSDLSIMRLPNSHDTNNACTNDYIEDQTSIELDHTLTSSTQNDNTVSNSTSATPLSDLEAYVESVSDSILSALHPPNIIDKIPNLELSQRNPNHLCDKFQYTSESASREVTESAKRLSSKSDTNIVAKLDTVENYLTTTSSLPTLALISLNLEAIRTANINNDLTSPQYSQHNHSDLISFSQDRQALEEQKRLLDLQIQQLTEEMILLGTGRAELDNNNADADADADNEDIHIDGDYDTNSEDLQSTQLE